MTDEMTALIILDVQNDTVSVGGAFESNAEHASTQKLIENITHLLDAARVAAVPVFHIYFTAKPATEGATYNTPLLEAVASSGGYIPGTWGAAPPEGLEPAAGEIVLQKTTMNGFAGTALEEHLHDLGIERLILVGALTNMSVEHTARHAADAGYQVVVVSDATSTINAEWQAAAIDHALSMVAEILTTEQTTAILT